MFNQLLPRTIDNTYPGRKLALWLFGMILFMKIAMSLNAVFNGRSVVVSADGIPLDTYPSAAAQTIVALFGLLGLANFMICLIGTLVLVRYRSMIPFMFALLLLEHVSKRLFLLLVPIVRTGRPPASAINIILLALMITGLALSLWKRGNQQ